MQETYVGKQIARTNHNLLIFNLLFVVAAVVVLGVNAKYLFNFFKGAETLSAQELVKLRSADDRLRNFVKVEGTKSFPSGVQYIEKEVNENTNMVESQTTKAEYKYLQIGERLLVVAAQPGTPDTTTSYSGELTSIPNEVRSAVITPVLKDYPTLNDRFLPFMLDSTADYELNGYVIAGLCTLVPLVPLWNLAKCWRRAQDPATHPIYRRLATYGNPEMLSYEIDAAVSAGKMQFGNTLIAGSWIFQSGTLSLKLMNLEEVVWAYKKVTKHSVNFIPVGKSYSALICGRKGTVVTISAGEAEVHALLETLMQRIPWTLFGFNAEIQKRWNRKRSELAALVDERKAQFSAQKVKTASAEG